MLPPHPFVISCIVSGGQTGVDRAALDVAIELGIPHRGWCPKGRRAEDGVIPPEYRLTETHHADYAERTRRNAEDSDATLILLPERSSDHALRGGTLLTWTCCQRLGRPVLLVGLQRPGPDQRVRDWLAQKCVQTLNIAGPRASKCPGIHESAKSYLFRILRPPAT